MSLTRLSLHRSDVERRVSADATPKKEIRGKTYIRTREELLKVIHLVHEAMYDEFVALSNFQARLGRFAPPTGFSAILSSDTTFRIDMIDRHLFRGLSMVELKRTTRFTDEDVKRGLIRLNQFIRDDSPLPACKANANRWIAALGSFAWIGVYERRGEEHPSYVLVVVAGMPLGMYQHFYKACEELHGKVSIKEASETVLYPTKKWTRENCGRLLAIAASALEEETVQTVSAPEMSVGTREENRPLPEQLWDWLPPPTVPIPYDYRLPRESPRGCPPFPSLGMSLYPLGVSAHVPPERVNDCPVRLLPLHEFTMDSFHLYSHSLSGQYVRHAGAVDMTETGGIAPLVQGPLDPILLRRCTKAPLIHGQFQAMPAQMFPTPKVGVGGVGPWVTWEDASLDENRLVQATYPVGGEGESDVVWDSIVSYHPVCIRVSCRDADDFVFPGDGNRKRMTGFCHDEWKSLAS